MGRISGFGRTTVSVQANPGSILQLLEQPSPLTVLPSSHSWPFCLSMGSSNPSPQAVAQAPPAAGQTGSSRQNGEQPSPVFEFLSSHCSLPSRLPSPHIVPVQVVGPMQPLACTVVAHFQPSAPVAGLLSSAQVGVQPSPAALLPSSHCSLPA